MNHKRDYHSYPIPSYNNYYQTPPVNNYRSNQQYNYPPQIPQYYDYDNMYTAPYGQNYNQSDYYSMKRPYNPSIPNNQRVYQQPRFNYNMNPYNAYNNYSNYPQDNDTSYYYNYPPSGNNADSDLNSYDVSR